jgi:anti-sigma28 factor (negative regulator of flagellin synthesis)
VVMRNFRSGAASKEQARARRSATERDEGTAMDDQSGGQVDQQLKQLMNELGAAINESLADSEQIAEVVSRIKDGGYDIFLVLEATIGVSKQSDKSSEKTSLVTTLSSNADLKISEQDLKFLKSLRIKLDEEEKKQ